MKIIPAIDIIDGNAVRLTGGDYAKKTVYSEHPDLTARAFESLGLKYLHLVDLDGAKAGKIVNIDLLKKIRQITNLTIDYGGGIQSERSLNSILDAGADRVTIGTLSVKKPKVVSSWIKKYGPEKIILGADVQNNKIAINGWQSNSNIDLFEFLTYYQNEGITDVICTDISKDGFLQGSSVNLYRDILNRFPKLNIIASGGVTTIEEIAELEKIGCAGAIVGKAIYEGVLLPGILAEWMEERAA